MIKQAVISKILSMWLCRITVTLYYTHKEKEKKQACFNSPYYDISLSCPFSKPHCRWLYANNLQGPPILGRYPTGQPIPSKQVIILLNTETPG